MIVKHLLIILVFLITRTKSSVPFISSLDDLVSQVSLEENILPKVLGEEARVGITELKPSLTPCEIIEQGEALRSVILDDDIEVAIKKIDDKLFELLASGVPLLDVTPIINCFFFDAEELVLVAKKVQAHTLLKILQLIYIWRDDAQFHWFQALSYHSPWYDQDMWNTHQMDWENNIWAICTWDNYALATVIQESIPTGKVLEKFNEKLLVLCAEYDAIKVFESTNLKPSQLGRHLGFLASKGSAKLLRLYQASSTIEHLHLERFALPEQLPANVEDFAFLMRHGQDCFPIKYFLTRSCDKGRLDLLKYLYELDPRLVPAMSDLTLVAEHGWIDIIQWIHQLMPFDNDHDRLYSMVTYLAICLHFEALNWLLDVTRLIISGTMIEDIITIGVLEALVWIDEKQPIKQGKQKWANLAAESCRLPILKWFHTKFGIFPNVNYLRSATFEMLEWIKVTDETLINSDLVKYGAANFEILKWVHRNAPISLLQNNIDTLAKEISSKEMMMWLYDNLGIYPADATWIYLTNDLELIKWATKTLDCPLLSKTAYAAAKRGHVHIIKWINENHPEYLQMPDVLKEAVEFGRLEVADYLIANFVLKESMDIRIDYSIRADKRLNILKWIHTCEYDIETSPIDEMIIAAFQGDLRNLVWLDETFPNVLPEVKVWKAAADHDHHEIYKWLLEKFPEARTNKELGEDIQKAFKRGYLEMVKMILDKNPLLVKKLIKLKLTRANYHIKRWAIVNGKWISDQIGIL